MITEKIVYAKLVDIFREIFDDESICIRATTSQQDIEEWDSLGQINLISAIEKEFGIRFKLEQIMNIENVSQIVDVIMLLKKS